MGFSKVQFWFNTAPTGIDRDIITNIVGSQVRSKLKFVKRSPYRSDFKRRTSTS